MSRIWTFVEMRWAKKGLSTLAHMDLKKVFPKEFYFMMDFLSIDEENVLADTLSKQFRKKSYEGSHWDSVITRYKEIELLSTRGQYQNVLLLSFFNMTLIVLRRLSTYCGDAEKPSTRPWRGSTPS